MGGRSDDYIEEALVSVMKRSSRKAGVLLGCNMQHHGPRLPLISVAIVFALSTSTVSGFIIRELETWDVTTDLDTEGSDLLEVWSDLRTPNKSKVTNENLSDKVIALNRLQKTTPNIIGKVLSTPSIINTNREGEGPAPHAALDSRGNPRSDIASTETIYDVYPASETVYNGNWDFKNDLNKVKEIENTKDSQNTTALKSYPKGNSTIENIENNQPRINLTQGVDNAGLGNRGLKIYINKYIQTTTTKPFTDSIDGILVELAINSTETTTNNINVETTTESKDYTVSTDDCTDNAPSSAILTEDVTLESVEITTTYQFSKNSETTTPQYVESFNTETGTDAPISTTLPAWKNYKTINRRRPTSKKENTEETTASEPKMRKTLTNVLENPLENSSIPSVITQEDTYFNYHMTAMAITEDIAPELETTTLTGVEAELQTTNLDKLVSNMDPKSTSLNKLTSNLHTRQTASNVQTTKLIPLLENTTIQTSTLDTISLNSRDLKQDNVLENFFTHNANWNALDTQLSKYDPKPENSNTQKTIIDTTLANINTQTSDTATTNMDTIVENANATLDSNMYTTPANLNTEMATLTTVLGKLDIQTTNDSQKDAWITKFDNKMEKIHAYLNRKSSISDRDLKHLDMKMAKPKTIPVDAKTEIAKFNTNLTKLDVKSKENFEIVSSKRAGYLDNSETTTTTLKSEIGTTAIIMSNKEDVKDSFATMYGGEESYGELNESRDNKKRKNSTESQRQLAEDAIEEELLIEKVLGYHKMLPSHSSPPTDDNSSSVRTYTLNDTNIAEKRNISALYTPSPNYKPAKKLEVQHLKQFVRDPDDNSWRNESISSLGIVFKPKNASKSFTEVLKNKTTELNSLTKQDNKTNVPVLRFRLEKMAELRKSKKKKNDSSETFYGDYEDASTEVVSPFSGEQSSITTPLPASITRYDSFIKDINTPKVDIFEESLTSTQKLRKNTVSDYYDSTDEYDYAVIPKMELKKFKSRDLVRPPGEYTTRSMDAPTTPLSTYPPNRQATVQYFPPTKKVTEKVVVNQYDDGFNMRLNQYTFTETSNPVTAITPSVIPRTQSHRAEENVSLKSQQTESNPESFGNINKASYIIRHYKDFINNAAKDSDDDRSAYMPYTQRPANREAISDLSKLFNIEYERAIMERFVDNFNQNSERFKVDFPILYNTSVVHRKEDNNGRVLASSNAIYKRLYESARPQSSVIVTANPCTSNCDNINVDLSPAYELHYYVPEQEEKEEMNPNQPVDTQLNRYRL